MSGFYILLIVHNGYGSCVCISLSLYMYIRWG